MLTCPINVDSIVMIIESVAFEDIKWSGEPHSLGHTLVSYEHVSRRITMQSNGVYLGMITILILNIQVIDSRWINSLLIHHGSLTEILQLSGKQWEHNIITGSWSIWKLEREIQRWNDVFFFSLLIWDAHYSPYYKAEYIWWAWYTMPFIWKVGLKTWQK